MEKEYEKYSYFIHSAPHARLSSINMIVDEI